MKSCLVLLVTTLFIASCENKVSSNEYIGSYVLKDISGVRDFSFDTFILMPNGIYKQKTQINNKPYEYFGEWKTTFDDYVEIKGYLGGGRKDTLNPSNWDFRPFKYFPKNEIRIAFDREYDIYYIKISDNW